MDKLMEEVEKDVERLISEKTRNLSACNARQVVEYVREELLTFLQGIPDDEGKKDEKVD